MKEPHRKGLANHSNPESCAGGGNIAGEALTGAHAGQPFEAPGGAAHTIWIQWEIWPERENVAADRASSDCDTNRSPCGAQVCLTGITG